tara:strand:+ start:485 stop:1648 length:1164 start_codon:yes stop_codon:yes gene_type:complete
MNSQWPCFEQDEIDIVNKVLKSGKVNYWTGSECKNFEHEFASYVGVNYAISVANGTLALELALNACNIGPGDEVITTCRTFLASASAIVMKGAKPVIVDVDLESQNITLETIKEYVTPNTKAIICVHLAGWPCEMDEIMDYAKEIGIFVIEDCAQAHGAVYKDRKIGSIGHIGCFSFCQDKIMTTGGEGGMVVTNDDRLWNKMWSLKDHGKDFDTVFNKEHPPGFRWLHHSFGTNFRMTEIQAAIGRRQLFKLEKWNSKRTKNVFELSTYLSKYDFIRIPQVPEYIRHAYYKFYVFFDYNKAPSGLTRDDFIERLCNLGLMCMQGSCYNITYEKAFLVFPDQFQKKLLNAELLGKTSIMFIIDHTIEYKISMIENILKLDDSNDWFV